MAVINELNKIETANDIYYIGSDKGLESTIIPQAGIEFFAVPSGKFRRYHQSLWLNIVDPTTVLKNGRDLFLFIRGYFKAKRIIKELDPDVVFTKGGYVSLPVGLAASALGYPLVIHESDSVMGLSNRLLAKRANVVCVSYPQEVYKEHRIDNLTYTGNPIREDIKFGSKKRAERVFGLNNKQPIILVIGGSQGAFAVNQLISDSLTSLLPKYQLIHVTGERDYDWLNYCKSKLDKKLQDNYHPYNYLSGDLRDAYAVADLVISRAGNNVIAELAALKKPTILIPLATSANNHQNTNARILSRMGAALLMLQEHLTPKKLVRQIDLLFEEPEEMTRMSDKIHQLAKNDAALMVAKEITELTKI